MRMGINDFTSLPVKGLIDRSIFSMMKIYSFLRVSWMKPIGAVLKRFWPINKSLLTVIGSWIFST